MPDHRYFMIHKPYGMESQFIPNYPGLLLGDLDFQFPEGTHAIGRLDKHSEGLLLLTTNKKITKLLFESDEPHRRTYLVQVTHKVSEESIQLLRDGVSIRIGEYAMYQATVTEASIAAAPSFPLPRNISPYVETSWLELVLTEGKYRQVRKMVAAIRHKCLRLIRTSIEDMQLGNLQPGQVQEFDEATFFKLLKLGGN